MIFILTAGAYAQLGAILQRLATGYDPLTRPNAFGNATQVQAQYRLNRLFEIDPKTNMFAMNIFLRLQWIDERLKFNDSLGSETLQLRDPAIIWTPDIYFYNSQEKKMETLDFSLKINGSTGQVFWSRHFLTRLTSNFDLRKFPFDSQRLEFQLASYANYANTMQLRFFPNASSKEPVAVFPDPYSTFSSVLWTLIGTETSLGNITYLPNQPVTDLLTYTLVVQRDPKTFVYKFILPLFFIGLASCLSYWIDPTAVPARAGFSVSLLVALVALNFVVSQDLPKVNYSTKLDTFVGVVIIFVFGAITEYAFIHQLRLMNKAKVSEKVENVFRIITPILLILWTVYLFLPGNSDQLDAARITIIVLTPLVLVLACIFVYFKSSMKRMSF